ncbi:peptide deformylase [Patescibacteria group bacterium]|nr:peptide deformylase [Patescibacteria group bacterium]MBU2158613.1 peptide deformylase [Patescibacteria group bacterium]MBU2220403.1 peptide deformylase [Patescibacteria group bacterium]
MIRETTQVGNPCIRAKASPAPVPSAKSRKIVTDLTDSMRHTDLVGMAAPQIGSSVRIFVTEVRRTKVRKPIDLDSLRVFINPEIIHVSKKHALDWEGCGSVAFSGLFGKVRRPVSVTVRAQDIDGAYFELRASGLLARIIQHEIDHLNGILFVDHCSPKTFMSANEYRKMRNPKN